MCMGELPLIQLQEVFAPARPTNLIQTIQRSGYLSILENKVINMARYTREEIENNYEFKVMRRLLKKEFPFITDMSLTHNWDDYKSLLFVDISLSPKTLMEYLNIPITPSSTKYLKYSSTSVPYMSMLFPSRYNKGDVITDLAKNIQAVITRVHQSSSIPDDMRLPRDVSVSSFDISSYDVSDNMTIPNN